MKLTIQLLFVLAIFCAVVGFIALKVLNNFRPYCGYINDVDFTKWNATFAEKEYSELKDLGKSFLTLLIGVFVASITFSEKIVRVETASTLSKSFLYLCWLLLLLSIVSTGTGLAFLAGCFNQALYVPCKDNLILFSWGAMFYVISGITFGMGLISMLIAGIVSFNLQRQHSVKSMD